MLPAFPDPKVLTVTSAPSEIFRESAKILILPPKPVLKTSARVSRVLGKPVREPIPEMRIAPDSRVILPAFPFPVVKACNDAPLTTSTVLALTTISPPSP